MIVMSFPPLINYIRISNTFLTSSFLRCFYFKFLIYIDLSIFVVDLNVQVNVVTELFKFLLFIVLYNIFISIF